MNKLKGAIIKELILLRRDLIGFAIIFLMPVILIITITFIQHSVENASKYAKFPIVVANQDKGDLSREVIKKLAEGNNFTLIQTKDNIPITAEIGKALLHSGKQQVLVVIPDRFSENVQQQINDNVAQILHKVVPSEIQDETPKEQSKQHLEDSAQIVELYFDPALNDNIRTWVKRGIQDMMKNMETQAVYATFENEFDADFKQIVNQSLIEFKEFPIGNQLQQLVPNAVQHNLPAWTLFAIFFIILPLSINIVKEKNQGTFIRLKTLPVSPFLLILSKIVVYLLVCMVQFFVMLFIAVYLFPLIGLPQLQIAGKLWGLTVVALFSGLAAIGFGVLIGTISKTHEQAAPFGATSVVILAAIGGLWFPIYAMPASLQIVAKISPMNWGLEGFYGVLLRNAAWSSIFPYLLALFLFFLLNMLLALFFDRKFNRL